MRTFLRQCQSPLTGLQLKSDLLGVGDVNAGTNIAQENISLIELRHAMIQQPPVLPVKATQPVLHGKWLACIKGRDIGV